MAEPRARPIAEVPNALPRSSGGKYRTGIIMPVAGMTDAPAACSTRARIIIQYSTAATPTSEPSANSTRPKERRSFKRYRSASFP
ncbi:hypothetical protein D3C75_1046680 [compost metagenome]